ncbi:MAG: hydrogenase formation protein HypD [Candidatus Limnocylindrales bacterium]
MKYVDEFRDGRKAQTLVHEIHRITTRPWTIMEVCGGQTHTIVKQGIDEMLPAGVRMIHGPGCPVCVTPLEQVDKALAIAADPNVIFTSYGDMLRVPGSTTDLLALRARGADVRTVYSPLDAVRLAREHPDRQVVFFAIGFETTAPANAMAVWQAAEQGIENFSVLVSHVLVPPAMEAILESPSNLVQSFLAAGHVCAVMGWTEYEPIAAKYHVPIVVTGFEPLDLLEGMLMAIRQLEEGRAEVENQYARAVRREGNRLAQETVFRVFEIGDRTWRGIGQIPASGYHLKERFARFDAERRFHVDSIATREHPACIAGEILQGTKTPLDCTAYGVLCNPQRPLGAPMVSAEGTCAAFHAAGRGLGPSLRPLAILSGAGTLGGGVGQPAQSSAPALEEASR